MKKKPFNISHRLRSFRYALKGIGHMLYIEHNAWIHTFALIVVVLAGFLFQISKIEWLFIVFAIGFVFTAEAINTAIELLVNKISPEKNEQAGLIKDVAAGAVLIAACTALAIGLIIFLPKIL